MQVQSISSTQNKQSFGMKVSDSAKKDIKQLIERGKMTKKIEKALKSLTETEQPNFELTGFSYLVNSIFIRVKNVKTGIETKLESGCFFAPRTLRKLQDDSYVAKLIEKAKKEQELLGKKTAWVDKL